MKRGFVIRALSLGLSLPVIAGLLASCGDSTGTDPDASYEIPTSTVGEGANGDETLKLPAYEFNDKTVTILTHVEDAHNYVFEETYGGKVDWLVVPADQRISRLQQMVNADEAPDLFNYDFLPSLITKELVQPVTKYIDLDSPLWVDIKESIERIRYKDDIYMVSPLPGRYQVVWYNKEIFENAGVKTPKELLDEGNWTWDTFRSTALELTVRGTDDTVTQWGAVLDNLDTFVVSTGHHFVDLDNGEATNNIKSEPIARAMNFYIDLFNTDQSTIVSSSGSDMFMQGKVAMLSGGLWIRTRFADMLKNDTIGFVPTPKDPQADKYYISEGLSGWYVPRGCDNPVGAAAYIASSRYLALDSEAKEKDFQNLQKECNWNQECQDMVDAMMSSAYSGTPDSWISFEVGEFYGDIFARPRDGEPWATIAEELYPKVENKIVQAYAS